MTAFDWRHADVNLVKTAILYNFQGYQFRFPIKMSSSYNC